MAKKESYKTGMQQVFVDEETGEIVRQTVTTEVVSGYRDVKLPEKSRFNNGAFITLFQASMLVIAKNRKYFSTEEKDILFYLLGTAGLGNSVDIDQPTLAEELGLQRTNVNKALKALEKKNIIITKKAGSRSKRETQDYLIKINFDQLNYNLAYNGKTKDHSKIKHKHPPIEITPPISPNQLNIFGQLPQEKI